MVIVLSTSNKCWIVIVPSPNAILLVYLTNNFFVCLLMQLAPRALIAKTKSNQSQEQEASLVEVLHSCLMSNQVPVGESVLEAY